MAVKLPTRTSKALKKDKKDASDENQTVPDPWTPVEAERLNSGALVMKTWGREYHFENESFPKTITTAGQQILAAPMRVVAETEKGSVKWKHCDLHLLKHQDVEAELVGWQDCDELTINTYMRLEYDGLMYVDVKMFQRSKEPALTKFWLEIPLKAEHARLCHSWPVPSDPNQTSAGSVENSGALPKEGLSLPFRPTLWVGWNEGGFSWCTESDRGWRPADPDRAIEVIRQGDQVLVRIRFLDKPGGSIPVCWSFAWQATPVKRWVRHFEQRRIHTQVCSLKITHVSKELDQAYLDQLAAFGVRMLHIWGNWNPIYSHWSPSEDQDEPLKKMVDDCHRRGIKFMPYYGYLMSTLTPEWGELAEDVLIKDPTGKLILRLPVYHQDSYGVCINSEWAERLFDGIANATERYGFDGIYLDGTTEPFGCANEAHGCGWSDDEGKLHVTYPVFAVRAFMRKLYERFHPQGIFINIHQSTYCGTATNSFSDCYWDGEQLGWGGSGQKLQNEDILRQFPLDCFQAEFTGRNFGLPTEFLLYEGWVPPEFRTEVVMPLTLLHDVLIRPWGLGMQAKITPIWNALEQFGVDGVHVEWIPYWRNATMLQSDTGEVRISLYRRSEGNRSSLLLVVVNFAGSQITARITLKPAAIEKIKQAKNALNREAFSSTGNQIEVSLGIHEMRLIEVR